MSRKDVWITSKLNNDQHDPSFVSQAIKQVLKDLQLDYLDLYLVHWPLVQGQKPGPKVDPPVQVSFYLQTWVPEFSRRVCSCNMLKSFQTACCIPCINPGIGHCMQQFRSASQVLPLLYMCQSHCITCMQATWEAMEKLVDEGLTRTIGISNFSVKKTKEVQSYARIQPAVNQVEIHPFWRNDKLWEYAQSSKVGAVGA